MSTLGIRCNNPGNIRYVEGETSKFLGCIGPSLAGFCVFDSPVHGIRAMAKLLRNYQLLHRINTIEQAVSRWAPPSENATAAYIKEVTSMTGYSAKQVLDFSNIVVLTNLVKGFIMQENGIIPYTAGVIAAGVHAALGDK